MRVLLDTHALVWWLLGDDRLSTPARVAIETASARLVSAASGWELTTKARIGRWSAAEQLAEDLPGWLRRQRMEAMAITMNHAVRSGRLPGPHRDPFDRMLIAQCQCEDLAIISRDNVFDRYGVRRIW